MRRLILWASSIYPAWWRQRYGDEFEALLEEVNPGWRVLLDVLGGVMAMRMANVGRVLAFGAAGAVIAAAVSLLVIPTRYVSTVVLEGSDRRLATLEQEILSRGQLAAIIQQPSLELYPAERERMDMESVVAQMRHHVTVRHQGSRIEVSFAYPDPAKARAVTSQFAEKMLDSSSIRDRNEIRLWEQFRADILKRYGPQAFPSFTNSAPPQQPALSIVSPAAPAVQEWWRGRWQIVLLGLALGALVALALQSPRWTLRFSVYAAAGCLVAFGASFLMHPMYTSTAILRIAPAHIPEGVAGVSVPSTAEKVRQAREELFTDARLTALFIRQSLPFTPADLPKLRQRIQVSMPVDGAFQITASDPNRLMAKQMADMVVAYLMDQNVRAAITAAKTSGNGLLETIQEHMAGENLEVLDPASLPVIPSSPDRLWFIAIGAAIGLLLAFIARGFRPAPPFSPAREDSPQVPPSTPRNLSDPFTMGGQNMSFRPN